MGVICVVAIGLDFLAPSIDRNQYAWGNEQFLEAPVTFNSLSRVKRFCTSQGIVGAGEKGQGGRDDSRGWRDGSISRAPPALAEIWVRLPAPQLTITYNSSSHLWSLTHT